MLTIVAFVLGVSLLIAIHEYGHYRMALACGVKVLRFSIGFGKPLVRWRFADSPTEFVLAMIPLGGYVKMLDEREGAVDPQERGMAFNTQSLRRRAAIVAAGPLANLLLAVVLYGVVNWIGVEQPAPVLAQPEATTLAADAGLRAGERVLRAGFDDAGLQEVDSFDALRWLITQGVLQGQDLQLVLADAGQRTREVSLRLSRLESTTVDAELFGRVGVVGPYTRALIGQTLAGQAAERAGLLEGDEVLAIDGRPVADGQQLRRLIRASGTQQPGQPQRWLVARNGKRLEVTLTPAVVLEGEQAIGRIGAYVGAPPEMTLLRFGVLPGLWRGVVQTWDVSALTLNMMGKMVMGQASLKNISGPLTIADYAGKSAGMGLTQYLTFLALISVSLGVLNLLPLPVLDGGHLMYYLWEGVVGRPVSERWMERLQRGGVALLTLMMSIALFNDVTRLFG